MVMIFCEKVIKTKAFLTNCTLDEGDAVAFLHVTLLNSVGGEAKPVSRKIITMKFDFVVKLLVFCFYNFQKINKLKIKKMRMAGIEPTTLY
jgi:hypothetical protein